MATTEPNSSERESAAENTVLTDVLGPHAKVRMLTAFIGENDRDLNATEVSRLAGIDRSTFYEHIDDLLDYQIVEETRTVGNSTMYRINRDNTAAEDLAQMEWNLLGHVSE